tara:strand:- start:249 stop:491 length:243 start_codon:yes stop_codon:yes gene_type:complete
MSLKKAQSILKTGKFNGANDSERRASRARWRRLVEKHANSPLILNEDLITLTLVCQAFIQLDSHPNLRPKARAVVELLFK